MLLREDALKGRRLLRVCLKNVGHDQSMYRSLGLFAFICLALAAPAQGQVRVDGRVLPTPSLEDFQPAEPVPIERIPNYRNELRMVVSGLAAYTEQREAREARDFFLVARNGLALLQQGGWETLYRDLRTPPGQEPPPPSLAGSDLRRFLLDLDAWAVDGQFCQQGGFSDADFDTLRSFRIKPIVFDSCAKSEELEAAAEQAEEQNIAFYGRAPAPRRYDAIPNRPLLENPENVLNPIDAQSALIVEGPAGFGDVREWVAALMDTNHDILVIPAFFDGTALTRAQVESLKYKRLGARRLVFAIVDIARATDSDYFWERDWRLGRPGFLRAPDPDRPDAVLVEFWRPEWLEIVGKTYAGVMDLGFDGVLLDGLDAHAAFETLTPIQ